MFRPMVGSVEAAPEDGITVVGVGFYDRGRVRWGVCFFGIAGVLTSSTFNGTGKSTGRDSVSRAHRVDDLA